MEIGDLTSQFLDRSLTYQLRSIDPEGRNLYPDLISFNDQQEDLVIEIIPAIGRSSSVGKYQLQQEILHIIAQEPTHLITGGYTFGNCVDRPDNAFLIIRHQVSQKIEILLNFAPNGQIIFLAPHTMRPGALQILQIVLNTRPTGFLFGTGDAAIEFVQTTIPHNLTLSNVVYKYDGHSILPSPVSPLQILLFDQTILNNRELEANFPLLCDFYAYDPDPPKLYTRIRQNPHILGIIDRTVVAGARANMCTPEMAIIGGVHTLPQFRRKGFGFTVCQNLVITLQERSHVIALETDIANFPAQSIYRHLGFLPVGKSMFFDRETKVIAEIVGDRDY